MGLARLWELLARKYNDDLSAVEQEELDQLLRQHQDALGLNEIMTRSADLEVRRTTTAMEEARSREWIARKMADIKDEPAPLPDPFGEPSRPWHRRPGFVWAIALVVFLGAGAWLYLASRPAEQPVAKPGEVATSLSKTRVTLPDGTSVILNKQSRISYNKNFGVTKRDIVLTGEAYFEVARNESMPLVVTAGPVKITVLGTAFNVRAYTGDSTIETSLIRGSIEVSSTNDPDRTILMRPLEKIVFSRAPVPTVAEASGKPDKVAPSFLMLDRIKPNVSDSSINEIVWVQDKLVFQREPFSSVARKMERWYRVKINFKDQAASVLPITGSLEKENLMEALEALQIVTPFDYSIENNVVTIRKRDTH
jgi:ferric-dicitrate binding protein FerR (iron transport regulator)